MNKKLALNRNKYNPFAIWLIRSVRIQAESFTGLLSNLEQKQKLTIPWIEEILRLTPEQFNQALRPLLFKILKNIDYYIDLFLNLSSFEKKKIKSDQLLFFLQRPDPPAPTSTPPQSEKDEAEKLIKSIEIKPTTKPIVPAWKPKEK